MATWRQPGGASHIGPSSGEKSRLEMHMGVTSKEMGNKTWRACEVRRKGALEMEPQGQQL
jgi:hypothetical protein